MEIAEESEEARGRGGERGSIDWCTWIKLQRDVAYRSRRYGMLLKRTVLATLYYGQYQSHPLAQPIAFLSVRGVAE